MHLVPVKWDDDAERVLPSHIVGGELSVRLLHLIFPEFEESILDQKIPR